MFCFSVQRCATVPTAPLPQKTAASRPPQVGLCRPGGFSKVLFTKTLLRSEFGLTRLSPVSLIL